VRTRRTGPIKPSLDLSLFDPDRFGRSSAAADVKVDAE